MLAGVARDARGVLIHVHVVCDAHAGPACVVRAVRGAVRVRAACASVVAVGTGASSAPALSTPASPPPRLWPATGSTKTAARVWNCSRQASPQSGTPHKRQRSRAARFLNRIQTHRFSASRSDLTWSRKLAVRSAVASGVAQKFCRSLALAREMKSASHARWVADGPSSAASDCESWTVTH